MDGAERLLVGTPGDHLVAPLQSALYGSGDARTPARMAVLRVVVSASLGVVLMMQMDRIVVTAAGFRMLGDLPAFAPLPDAARAPSATGDLLRLRAVGLSLASGLAAWLENALLRRAVRRAIGATSLAGGQLRPVLIATSIAALTASVTRLLASDLHLLAGGTLSVSHGRYLPHHSKQTGRLRDPQSPSRRALAPLQTLTEDSPSVHGREGAPDWARRP